MEIEILRDIINKLNLNNSYVRINTRLSRDEIKHHRLSKINYDEIIKREQVTRLVEFILEEQPDVIKKIETEDELGEVEYRTELLVFKLKDFKSILEKAISIYVNEK
jgi:hypothetical protein